VVFRFVHERGTRTALFNLAFMAGVSIGPLIAGQLIQRYDWRVCSYAMSAALVVNLILTVFFMPETAYHRTGVVNFDTNIHLVCAQVYRLDINLY
jgi:MFS family permease